MYSIIYTAALLLLFPFEYLKRPKELRRRWLKERFGRYRAKAQRSGNAEVKTSEPVVWIHAVSVGEVIAVVPLIKRIKDWYPSGEIVVSTVTDTGQKVAIERIGDIARTIYAPFDLSFAISSALKKIRPSLFIIIETELWPNILRILNRRNIPVLLLNGRISEKSFSRYKKLRFFMKGVLKNVSVFCMQNELYAERIRELGAESDKIKIVGNFKFDTRPSDVVPKWTEMISKQITEDICQTDKKEFTIIAGSTHRTEEDLILDTYIRLKEDFSHLNLIIAPRHPERFKEVEALIKSKNIQYIKRSEIVNSVTHAYQHFRTSALVILLDVIGELSSVYGACDVAIIGGSFIEHGGQNPLEPAYWGKAIICGPHMENFPFIDEFYRNGGAIKANQNNLYQIVKELLNSKEKILSMGRVAQELYKKNAGAVNRSMEIIDLVIRNQNIEDRLKIWG